MDDKGDDLDGRKRIKGENYLRMSKTFCQG